ncbi:hypothetical protein [Limnospira indica]|uniref:hypothetical protein n=1 Tax=Limnospira indica TaxID=147322 RepID=UPI00031D64A5|nr:hypothetical protein [Limnospira indica]QNH55620.1 MAG: hypothetical protein H2674_14270 [Limnospira indica BM01]
MTHPTLWLGNFWGYRRSPIDKSRQLMVIYKYKVYNWNLCFFEIIVNISIMI